MPVKVRFVLQFFPLFFPLVLASAQETVYLKNGFSLLADSHTEIDGRVVLRTGTGTVEFPASDVAGIEPASTALPGAPLKHPDSVPVANAADGLLEAAAWDQQLPPEFVHSVAKVESNFRADAVSSKGAVGLMQLMPSTARELGVDPARAGQNAEGGAKYLRALLVRYHGDSALALAAYNAGPGTVDRFGGVPPYVETRRYVLKVLREYERQHKPQQPSSSKPSATN